MSSPARNSQPKTPRRSSRQSNRNAPGSEQQPQNQSRRGGRRSAKGAGNHNQQHTQAPEWDAAPANEIRGDFDGNGNFVVDGNDTNTRKRSVKKNNSTSTKSYQPAINGEHETPAPAQIPALPFPTLRGTPHKPYAGPTFHASPAPSALPMPKFFSKSVPNIASTSQTMQARAEQESDENKASESSDALDDSPSMPQAQPNAPRSNTDSPLDLFFSADRAERAKQLPQPQPASEPRRPASVQVPQAAPTHWASIYGATRPPHTRNYSADSNKGMFMMELDSAKGNGHRTPPHDRSIGHRATTEPAAIQQMANIHHGKASPSHTTPLYQAPNYGNSTPVLPSEMEGSPAGRPGSIPSHNQSTPNLPPRSADSTPLQTPPASNGYNQSYHYGNRNLSPLFQAARNPTPRTRSQLRQEFAPPSPTPANELPGSIPPFGTNPPMVPADAAARKFLSDMIKQAPAAGNMGSPFSNAAGPPGHVFPQYGTPPYRHTPEPIATPRLQATAQVHGHHTPATVTRTGSMEEDLKRMLKITGN